MLTIGEKIVYLRLQRYMSREDLSAALNVNRTTVFRWEKNKVTPSEMNLIQICRYFKIDKHFFDD